MLIWFWSCFTFTAETILSVIKSKQSHSDNIYGVKYKLFGVEGRAITLTNYDQWNPFCLQYSATTSSSQVRQLSYIPNKIIVQLYGYYI